MSKFNKFLILVLLTLLVNETTQAGGIVTNTNQSAAYSRTLCRDASTEADAVYFNPAGLTAMPNGFFLSLSNQTIFQTRKVTNDYQFLNTNEYDGTAEAPLFPSVYAGYKTGNFVFSLGFNPVGGGGGAEYPKGLPSFYLPISDLVPALGGPANATYSTDIYFKGTSVYFGLQGGVSYKINDLVSVFAGVRYNMASNTYEGYLRNTSITTKLPTAYTGRADLYLQGVAQKYKAAKEQYAAAGKLDSAAKYGKLEAETGIRATLLGDQEAEVAQSGSGITPIFGVNFSLLDKKLNIGLKYEMNTGLVIKNDTKKDIKVGFDVQTMSYITQFPDEAESNQDIPALLSVGAQYKLTNDLSCMVGYHQFFDKSANWDGLEDSLTANSFEFGVGLEYKITSKLLVSAGFLMTGNGAENAYQSDMSYTLPSNSFTFGGKYALMNNLDLNLGFVLVNYNDGEKLSNHNVGGSGLLLPANYTFEKSSYLLAIGFDYTFGK
jgi:long-subunit fatty acid transport protein